MKSFEWISVDDRLPEKDHHRKYLTYNSDTSQIYISEYCSDYSLKQHKVIWFWDFEFEPTPITHWMPLPEKPNVD
jgi:uncharacterized protein DUF551